MGKTKDGKDGADSSKYVRYTSEQVDVLERIYNECPKPSSSRRQLIIKEFPVLANIGQKQLKVWFQNRRCREKQRKETGRLQSWNMKLNAMNQILLEENERLQKLAAQLASQNQHLRQQLQITRNDSEAGLHPEVRAPQTLMTIKDASPESVVTSQQHHKLSPLHQPQDASILQLMEIADKTYSDFLAKATGNMGEWIPISGMKPGPYAVGATDVSRFWGGVAARACSVVGLEPFKVAEIVKQRPQWLDICRRTDILATFNAESGGVIEFVHTQMYASSALTPAWDLFTLRYTILSEDGNLVICESSLNNMSGFQICPPMVGSQRKLLLPSGYLIKPHASGGSLVMVIENLNFELETYPGRLYEPELMLILKTVFEVLHHLQNVAGELKGGIYVGDQHPNSLRRFSRCLTRGFSSAVNCLSEDGWIPLPAENLGPVTVYLNPRQDPSQPTRLDGSHGGSGVICARVSVLLQGISATSLIKYMQENYALWTQFGVETIKGSVTKCSFVEVHRAAGSDEFLEVVKFNMQRSSGEDIISNGLERFILQLHTGVNEVHSGQPIQIIYAPIDASVPNEAALLPSGFRIYQVDPGKMDNSLLGSGIPTIGKCENNSTLSMPVCQYVLTMAFQFMCEPNMHKNVALEAQHFVQGVLDVIHSAIKDGGICDVLR